MHRRTLILVCFLPLLASPLAFACSCSNSTPIQRSSPRYSSPEHAVFTARVIQLVGGMYNWDGKKLASMALAVVHERHWGLPWYWPKIVLLDGTYPCDIVMEPGVEYLVAGRKERYGIVWVSMCSRTQPLATAQIDLRTLDGTRCAAPGGTMIGHIYGEWDDVRRVRLPVRLSSVGFIDSAGKAYRTNVDASGIYEIRHVSSAPVMPVSLVDDYHFVHFAPTALVIHRGTCEERDLGVFDYQLTGRLLPGIGRAVEVQAESVIPGSTPIRADAVEADGRFYFQRLPPGEYRLSVTSTIGDVNPRIYYPGVLDRAKAIRVRVDGRRAARSYDFPESVLPVVPIPLILDSAPDSDRYLWNFQLAEGGRVVTSSRADGTNIGLVYGMRGGSYNIRLYGYPHEPRKDDYCKSALLPITASAGMSPVHILAKCASVDR